MLQVDPAVLRETIKELGLSPKNTSNSYIFVCPICGKDKLYMHKKIGFFKCFVCADSQGFKGACDYGLAKLSGKKTSDIKQLLYGAVKFEVEWTTDWKWAPYEDLMDELVFETVLDDTPTTPVAAQYPLGIFPYGTRQFVPALKYLLGRGVTIQQMIDYELQYDIKQQRVVFPVTYNKMLIGWQGRYINDCIKKNREGEVVYRIPKILTSAGLTGGRFFMFWDQSLTHPSDSVILCEGPVSGLHAMLPGLAPAIVSMGKSITQAQLALLATHPAARVYLCLDPDAATDCQRILDILTEECPSKQIYFMQVPKHRDDVGACTSEEVTEMFNEAKLIRPPYIFTYFKEATRW